MHRRIVIGLLLVAVASSAGHAAAAPPRWTGRYTVRAGDSLGEIAQRYAVSLQTLARVNRLDWHAPLLIGVVLRVPAKDAPAPAWAGAYVVRPGDTLSGIALRFHVSLSQLAAANSIDPAGLLLSGSRLRVPRIAVTPIDLAHIVENNVYSRGAIGYDVSYPNCAVAVPASPVFAVIGLNGGRPFTTNPCFASEWAAARKPRGVYINTAYGPALFHQITPACDAAGSDRPLGPALQRAYAVGCSEAAAALKLLAPVSPLAIWVDIEPANTWSSRRGLNVATIEGILDRLLAQAGHPMIGVYSDASFWHRIVGDWRSLSVPEWIAPAAVDPPGCPLGFAAGPVWLNQSSNGELDLDTAC